jgi:GNAT superfamily N-acetyltransferase
MIRPTPPGDTPALVEIAAGTDVFKPEEVETLRDVLDDHHGGAHEHGHRAVTYSPGGEVSGFAYFAPMEMTDRTWYLWWIAVRKTTQARGVGGQLLRHVEEEARREGCLLMLPRYEPTRRFYLKHGYETAAVLRDFYSDGDDLVVFGKRLSG